MQKIAGAFLLFVSLMARKLTAWHRSANTRFRTAHKIAFHAVAGSNSIGYDPSKVKITESSELNGKFIVSGTDLRKGDVVLSIPIDMCLVANKEGQVFGLQGQSDFIWEVAGDLREPVGDADYERGRTWDVQLAVALLQATDGSNMHSSFWNEYTKFIQSPIHTTVPFTWKSELLDILSDDDIRKGAIDQKSRLKSLFPDLCDRKFHRVTSEYTGKGADAIPNPLEWAFAMVRSRCFEFVKGWFAVVPLIEMANHRNLPNARFVTKTKDGKTVESVQQVSMSDFVFCLEATDDIARGEEITIQYIDSQTTKTNRRLFVQYGFSLPDQVDISLKIENTGILQSLPEEEIEVIMDRINDKSSIDLNLMENICSLLSSIKIPLNDKKHPVLVLEETLNSELERLRVLLGGKLFENVETFDEYLFIRSELLIRSANISFIEADSLIFEDIFGTKTYKKYSQHLGSVSKLQILALIDYQVYKKFLLLKMKSKFHALLSNKNFS